MVVLQDYTTPEAIEAQSFTIIDAEVRSLVDMDDMSWSVARRLIHTSGDVNLIQDIHVPLAAVHSGLAALRAGCRVYTDTEMVRAGIPLRRVTPFGVSVECMLAQEGVAEYAKAHDMTRSRAGVEILGKKLDGAIVAIGNAPTALLALLELVKRNSYTPALVIGMPVGFVNAAESKELLLAASDIPSIVIRGRRGGSPLAAAAVNALACLL